MCAHAAHQEFLRNLKREYGKLLAVLQAYALICRGVRLVVTHATGRSPRVTVLHTQGSSSLRDNIITVLGAKALATMQPLDVDLQCSQCRVTGFVSMPTAGAGRASGDRQFLTVNGRPVDLPRVVRALNEAYHSFNAQQTPAAVLDFTLPTSSYDINVTPDKRRIMLHAEEALIAAFSDALLAVWAPSRETFAVGEAGGAALPTKKRERESTRGAGEGDNSGDIEWDSQDEDTSEDEDEEDRRARRGDSKDDTSLSDKPQPEPSAPQGDAPLDADAPMMVAEHAGQPAFALQQAPAVVPATGQGRAPAGPAARAQHPGMLQASIERFAAPSAARVGERVQRPAEPNAHVPSESDDDNLPVQSVQAAALIATASQLGVAAAPPIPLAASREKAILPFDLAAVRVRLCIVVFITLTDSFATPLQATRDARTQAASAAASKETQRQQFKASSLRNPGSDAAGAQSEPDATGASSDAAATAELERVFNKAEFASLDVVGQFNLGFILATLHGNDLFIIDQHASDEIFNFERLQRTTQLTRQPLLVPQALELSPAEAQTVLHHMDMFRANGFDIDQEHEGTSDIEGEMSGVPRLRLTAVPVSKNVTFDSSDVHELAALLDGRPLTVQQVPAGPFGTLENGIIRPAKVRSMLAMRACRSSIMIGRALDKPQARNLCFLALRSGALASNSCHSSRWLVFLQT